MKKTTKTLIISITAVVLLVGVFLLVYFLLPQQEDPKDKTNDDYYSETESEVPAEYPLVNHVPADIETIEVDNETGKYTIKSETPTTEVTASDGTTSVSTEATVYTLVGYEDMELETGSPDTLANDAAAVTAGKIVDDGSKKSDFGFDKPRSTVTVTYKGGETATFIVGDDAPADQGTYLMMKGDDNVYLVTSDSVDGFLMGAMGMISTEIGYAADDDANNVFKKMVFGGTLFGGDVVFEYANSESFSETYRITSPDNVLANEEVVTYMINNVRNLTAKEVISVGAKDEQLKEYGLDEPYVTVEAEYPDLKASYKASKPDGEGYFYLFSNGVIYKMSTDTVPWVLNTYEDCIVKSVLRPKYGSVTGIEVQIGDEVYDFDVKTEMLESEDTDQTTTKTTVTCNGNSIDEDKFNMFYQNIVSAERSGGVEKVSEGGKALLKVTYTFADGTTGSAEYFEGENRKCPVLVNGSFGTLAYESYVAKMIEDTPAIAANKAVKGIY